MFTKMMSLPNEQTVPWATQITDMVRRYRRQPKMEPHLSWGKSHMTLEASTRAHSKTIMLLLGIYCHMSFNKN